MGNSGSFEPYLNEHLDKRTGIFVLEAINDFKISEDNKLYIEYLTDLYIQYVNVLEILEDKKTSFLEFLLEEEIKRNQLLENVDPVVFGMIKQEYTNSATKMAIQAKKDEINVTPERLSFYNEVLLEGLVKKGSKLGLRTENNSYVGTPIPGGIDLDFIPIDYKEINKAAKRILKMYNVNAKSEEEVFTKPMLIHAAIAALQLFRDANTRLARLLQHVDFWYQANEVLGLDLTKPALYSSEIIGTYGKNENPFVNEIPKNKIDYRKMIVDIALHPDDEVLNRWLGFNLKMFDDQIFLNQNRIEEIHKHYQRRENML